MTRILVVDDEPDTRGLIELTLQTAGYDVSTAHGGVEGLRLLGEESFDVVLLDVMMPDVSGFDVLRQLQEMNDDPPPVLFLSAKTRTEDLDAGKSLGAAGYLGKPITRGELLDAVDKALNP